MTFQPEKGKQRVCRVLVVDDVELLVKLLAAQLNLDGHTVVTVEHPRALLNPQAPEWFQADALLCDLHMPELDGIEIGRVAMLHHRRIQRICLTGLYVEDRRRAAAAVVFPTIITKPGYDKIRQALQ